MTKSVLFNVSRGESGDLCSHGPWFLVRMQRRIQDLTTAIKFIDDKETTERASEERSGPHQGRQWPMKTGV